MLVFERERQRKRERQREGERERERDRDRDRDRETERQRERPCCIVLQNLILTGALKNSFVENSQKKGLPEIRF